MSLEVPEPVLPDSKNEVGSNDTPREPTIRYTREFLLSIGSLDTCRKLPADCNASIISEFEEVCVAGPDQPKVQYGGPIGRSEGSVGHFRGSTGRWETWSSGSSDKEGDSHEREISMQDRRSGNQYRRQWQKVEHDGLLGSGAVPRPLGYVGTSTSKGVGSATYQLNRSNEPYQPPRPYKAAQFSKKDIDSCNDETFGSLESSNVDRAEEERKRRASFEMMRKEQHKALQEKVNDQKGLKARHGDDLMALLLNSDDKKTTASEDERADGDNLPVYQQVVLGPSQVQPTPAIRPVVPPGFVNQLPDRKFDGQSLKPVIDFETANSNLEKSFPADGQGTPLASVLSSSNPENDNIVSDIPCEAEKHVSSGQVTSSHENESSVGTKHEARDDIVVDVVESGGSVFMGSSAEHASACILESLFGNVSLRSDGSSPDGVEDKHPDGSIVPSAQKSSKFSQWFLEQDSNSSENASSLIVGNENSCPSADTNSPPSLKHSVLSSPVVSFDAPRDQYHEKAKPELVPVVMTCEDLEQSLLADLNNVSSSGQLSGKPHEVRANDANKEQEACVANRTSHHLLSLLQKGTTSSPAFQEGSSQGALYPDMFPNMHGGAIGTATSWPDKNVPSQGKNLTLEALFGDQFMHELHSMDAPVSLRSAADSAMNHPAVSDPIFQGPSLLETGGYSSFSLVPGQFQSENEMELNRMREIAAPRRTSTIGSNFSVGGREVGVQLPEEDSLISVNNLPFSGVGNVDGLLNEKAVDFHQHLLGRNSADAQYAQMLGPDVSTENFRGPFRQTDSDNLYQLLQCGSSSHSQVPHPLKNANQMYQHMEQVAIRNQQMPFNASGVNSFDPNHPYFPNAVQPHFDPASRHRAFQQMPHQVNILQHYPFSGSSRGVPARSMHPMPGVRTETRNYPAWQRLEFEAGTPGGSGMDMGSSDLEDFQMLMKMEMRVRSKQLHSTSHGYSGPNLDVNFRYR